MVKGVSRRVVVVQPENGALFEQAIFLVKDYTTPKKEIVREACQIANRYLGQRKARKTKAYRIGKYALAFTLGAFISSFVWVILMILR